MIELIGEFPQSLAFSGKYSSRFFNRKGASCDSRSPHQTHLFRSKRAVCCGMLMITFSFLLALMMMLWLVIRDL